MAEKDALILTLLARVEELAARMAALEAENAALRARLALPPKTPDNSSTPPAQGHKANAPPPGRRGGGKAHAGAHRPLHPNPPRRREIIAARCRYCRADVSGVGPVAKERHDRIEIPQIQPEVTRVKLHGGVCPIRARRRAGTVLEADETRMRVGQRTWWNWVFYHADSACFVLAPSRARALVAQFLDQHRPEFRVSDRLAAQRGWAIKEHQVCLAHLIRAAQYAIAAGETVCAPGVQKRLRQACAIRRTLDALPLTPATAP